MQMSAIETLDLPLVHDFVIAMFIGALIGIEREYQKGASDPQFGGLRTFVLCALFGALAGALTPAGETPVLLVAGLLGLMGLLAVTTYIEGREAHRVPGLTTEVAAVVTYLLGGTVSLGHAEVAVMLAIATLAVLTFKQPLHAAVRALGRDDLIAGIKLLAATFIVLPLIPNRTLDPWGALNPYTLWLLVLLISGLSLVGYVAMRVLGTRRGVALTGVFGGLVSSTAVTLSLARRSRDLPGVDDAMAVGVLLSWTIMSVRVVIEVAVLDLELLWVLLPSLLAMLAVSAVLVAWFYRRPHKEQAPSDAHGPAGQQRPVLIVKNPFSLGEAVKFALLFAVVLLVVKLAQLHLPGSYLYAVAAVAGSTDVDAITLSLAQLSGEELARPVAALAILVAVWSNTALKCLLVLVYGSAALRVRAMVSALAIALAGGVAFALG